MRQAWHIFQKDVRSLQRELAIYLGSLFAAWWLSQSNNIAVAGGLVGLAAAYLTACLIQADAPAGDRQFWITRPYRWTSLIAAKLLFIVVLIDLPVMLAQWMILASSGFPFPSIWAGLLWEQFLWFAGLSLPVAALAALTSGLVPFVSSVLVTAAVLYGVSYVATRPDSFLQAIEWVRSSVALVLVLLASGTVLYLQYRKRQTVRSRLIAFYIVSVAIVACLLIPWKLAFAIQQRLSTRPSDPSSILVTRDAGIQNWAVALAKGKRVEISVPLVVQGLPLDVAAKPEALEITLRADGGLDSRLQSTSFIQGRNPRNQSHELTLTARGGLDRNFFDSQRDRRVTLRGSLYLTFFGNKKSYALAGRDPEKGLLVTDKVRCIIAPFGVVCDSPLRQPSQRIDAAFLTAARVQLNHRMSYSPFPADLRFYPLEIGWVPPFIGRGYYQASRVMPDLNIEVAEPVAYVRRDFEIREIPLLDIAIPWRSQRVAGDGRSPVANEY